MSEASIIYKRFNITIDSPGTSYNKKFDLDKTIKVIRGILISSDYPKNLYYRGSQRIEVSGDELFPEDYESKLLMTGVGVPPDDKFKELGNGVLAGNGEVKILYKDEENDNAPFSPYQFRLILKCELK